MRRINRQDDDIDMADEEDGQMTITLFLIDSGDEFSLDVEPDDTIEEVRQKIQR